MIKKPISKSNNNSIFCGISKDFVWNMIGTGTIAVLSFVLMVIVTRINGLDDAGIFSYGFGLANLMYIFACYGGRSYQVTDSQNEFANSQYVSSRVVLYFISLIFSIILLKIFNYHGSKFIVLFIIIASKCLEAVSDTYYGILQKKDKLYIAGVLATIKNIIVIIVFVLVDYYTKSLFIAAISWLLISLLMLFILDIPQSQKVEKVSISLNGVGKIIRVCFYFFAFIFASNILFTIPRVMIDQCESLNIQAIFNIILMPATVLIVAMQFVLQPFLVKLTNQFNNDIIEFKKNIRQLLIISLLIMLLAIGLTYFIGIPILNLIYGIDLNSYKNALLLVILTGGLYALTSIIHNATLIMRKVKEVFSIYLIDVMICIFSCYFLVKLSGIVGAIYGLLITFSLLLIMLLVLYELSIKGGVNSREK